jgi:hypothetical protein
MSMVAGGPAYFPNPTGQPTSDGERPIHGCYSEDLRDIPGGRQLCAICATWAHGSWPKYVQFIRTYHNVELSGAENSESELLVLFSNEAVPQENEPAGFIEKILRWNKHRKEYAEERGG